MLRYTVYYKAIASLNNNGWDKMFHSPVVIYILFLHRNELCSVQELIKSEELSKEELMEELKTLQEEHQKEMTAIQHSRKFSKLVSII